MLFIPLQTGRRPANPTRGGPLAQSPVTDGAKLISRPYQVWRGLRQVVTREAGDLAVLENAPRGKDLGGRRVLHLFANRGVAVHKGMVVGV
jgi:hypothetical protein